jgi:multidrug efflux system membrane fusion protein
MPIPLLRLMPWLLLLPWFCLLAACSSQEPAARAGARGAHPDRAPPRRRHAGVRGRGARPHRVPAGLPRRRQDGQRQAEVGDVVKAGQVLARLDPRTCAWARRRRARRCGGAGQPRHQAGRLQALQGTARPGLHQRCRTGAARCCAEVGRAQLEQARAQAAVQGNQAAYATLVADAPAWWWGWMPSPARCWPPARRCCAWRTTARATWCSAVPEDRGRLCAPLLGKRRRAVSGQACGAPPPSSRHRARGGGGGRPGDAHLPGQGRHRPRRCCAGADGHRASSCRGCRGVKLPLPAVKEAGPPPCGWSTRRR